MDFIMGVYAVTGGSNGIGKKAAGILSGQGHEVINIDIDNGDISADLGTAEGRELAISQMHDRCPDGLDGLICCAGRAGIPKYKFSYVLSVNYFGTVLVAEGLFDLLKKKKGNCAVTLTGTVTYPRHGKYSVVELLNNCGDEERIGRLVDTFDPQEAGDLIYMSSKVALARWMRRTSSSWAARGVNLNAVAPGAADTNVMQGYKKPDDGGLLLFPMPVMYGQQRFMDPADVAKALAFLALPGAHGMSGSIIFCDAGTSAINNTEL